jgi:hypothetical protein
MNKAATIVCLCGLLAGVNGCGDNLESLVREDIRILNDAADEMHTIKDESSAAEARPKLRAINQRWRANHASGQRTEQERRRLYDEYGIELETASRRCKMERERLARLPSALAALKELDDIKPENWDWLFMQPSKP